MLFLILPNNPVSEGLPTETEGDHIKVTSAPIFELDVSGIFERDGRKCKMAAGGKLTFPLLDVSRKDKFPLG